MGDGQARAGEGAGAARAGLAGQWLQSRPRGRVASGLELGSERPDIRRLLRLGARARGDLGRRDTGRRVEARPAAGLGDLSRRRPLALDAASAGRAGTCLLPKLAGPGPRTYAGHAVAAKRPWRPCPGAPSPSRPVRPTPGEAGAGHCPRVPAPSGRNRRRRIDLGRGVWGWALGRRLGLGKGGPAEPCGWSLGLSRDSWFRRSFITK